LYIEITQRGEGLYGLHWKTPSSLPEFNRPTVALLEPCTAMEPPIQVTAPHTRGLYHCSEGLGGNRVGIRYPVMNPSVSSLVRVVWASGETRSILAGPDESQVVLPSPETTAGVARTYLVLGIDHILAGYDHLLFLACLLLIAGTGRRILITVTGFTLAHSVTLAIAALGLLRVPAGLVEAAIALSIVFVAREIAGSRRDSLTWRHPIAVSSSFGLLHGFGFAAVLGEIGLPQMEIPTALLFFNVGVEIGQLAFVSAVALALWASKRWRHWIVPPVLGRVETSAAYVVGSLASLWLIERISTLLA
jgi:hydrogenase/urease accessory protein HupE